ncbi:hypothetical protein LXL04_022841 [Taraxacum kok-saghyz]
MDPAGRIFGHILVLKDMGLSGSIESITKKTIQTITRQLRNSALENAQEIYNVQNNTDEEQISIEQKTESDKESNTKETQIYCYEATKKTKTMNVFYFFFNFNVNFIKDFEQRAVRQMRLGSLLEMSTNGLPGKLSRFVVDNFDPTTMNLNLPTGSIEITEELVSKLTGIPLGIKEFTQ